ncbi:hypothetical protein HDU98_010464 [Podochytrium sp. JEL0797]|nr:hypothetical protein HDU98_010464 [Podochytrium sp. JEL0797]
MFPKRTLASDAAPPAKRSRPSVAELKAKHKLARQGLAPADPAAARPVTPPPLAKPAPALAKPKPAKPLLPKKENPFSLCPSAAATSAAQPANPFSLLKSIESSGSVFRTSNARMKRYVSSPNVLLTAPWQQKPSRIAHDEEDEEDENESEMSDLEGNANNDDVAAFRQASVKKDPATLVPANSDTHPPVPLEMQSKVSENGGGAKPRLFSILVDKKTASFEKVSFTSCKNVFKAPPKKSAIVESRADAEVNAGDDLMPDLSTSAGSVKIPESTDDSMNDFDFDPMVSSSETSLIDHSIKTNLTIISSEFQPWFKERTDAENYATIQNHITKTPSHSMTLKAQFDNCLVTHVYPNGPKAPTHVGLMTRILAIKPGSALKPFEKSELAYYMAKEDEWCQSFKSIFASLQLGHADHFYYINSEFTVLFQAPGALGNTHAGSDFRAVLAKASPGLRNALARKGLKFTMVIAPAKVKSTYTPMEEINAEEQQQARDELKAMEILQPGRTIAKSESNRSPLQLVFSGLDALTQLRAYLLEWVEQSVEKRALNQPMLISPAPFLNASVKMANIIKIEQIEASSDLLLTQSRSQSTTHRLSSKPTAPPQPAKTTYKLKLSGLILPHSLLAMQSIIETSSLVGDHVRLVMDLEERTAGVNVEVGSVEVVEGEGEGEEGVKVEVGVCGKTVKVVEFLGGKWV